MFIPKPGKCDREREMIETLTKSGGFSFGCIGLIDSNSGRILTNWVSPREPGRGDAQSEKTLKAISRILMESLALSRDKIGMHLKSDLLHHKGLKTASKIFSGRHMIGIGSSIGSIASIAAFSTENSEIGLLKKQRVLLDIALTYADQVLHQHLETSKDMCETRIQESILQRISSGLAAVERDGSVRYINTKAIEWINSNEELCLANGKITSKTLTNRTLLQKSISRATSGPGRLSVMRVQSLEEGLKTITVLPIDRAQKIALLVFVGKNSCGTLISEHLLTTLGLTVAERKLTGHLLLGKTLAEAAAESNLTISTARSYLKMIFSKTGIHRQSELIALYYKLLPPIHLEPLKRLNAPSRPDANIRNGSLPNEQNVII